MRPADTAFALTRGFLAATWMLLSAPRVAFTAEECRAIPALPTTITEPGRHCLTADARSRSGGGAAITVMADWVTIDLRGHRLHGAQRATAIEAVDHRGITIRDGTIAGFGEGIRLSGRRGGLHLIEGIRVLNVSGIAVRVEGTHNIIRNNWLSGRSDRGPAEAWGIVAHGPLSRILGNNVRALGAGTLVEVTRADGAIVEGNVLVGRGAPADAIGIRVVSGSDVIVVRNDLLGLRRSVRPGMTDANDGQ